MSAARVSTYTSMVDGAEVVEVVVPEGVKVRVYAHDGTIPSDQSQAVASWSRADGWAAR